MVILCPIHKEMNIWRKKLLFTLIAQISKNQILFQNIPRSNHFKVEGAFSYVPNQMRTIQILLLCEHFVTIFQ